MEPFFGSIILELIGASAKWIYFSIKSSMLGKARPTFKEIYDGKEKKGSAEYLYEGMSNVMTGIVVLFVLVCVFLKLANTFRW